MATGDGGGAHGGSTGGAGTNRELAGRLKGPGWWGGEVEELPRLPLGDEFHVETWRRYATEAGRRGAWNVLRERLVQLAFPVREGQSTEEVYRAATLRGAEPPEGPGLVLERPDELRILLHGTPAGTVPVLVAGCREDFVALVRALVGRNEPMEVPPSMGAALVNGYNNWDRIREYRRAWEAGDPVRSEPGAWEEEFRRIVPRRELYRDRFVILSRGPYSGVAATDVGLHEDEWLEASLSIRLEHECTHYLALRVFGALRHDILEELVADFVGIVRTFGRFRPDLARLFLGLEASPEFRPGGRLEVYRGDPPLSREAFGALQRLAWEGIEVLDTVARRHPGWLESPLELGRLVVALTTLGAGELTLPGGPARVEEAVERVGT